MPHLAEKLSPSRKETVTYDTQSRLIRALCELWVKHSQAEISVRMVARQAEASVSAIDYHFGSLEHLFASAQATALDEARLWTSSVFDELRQLPLATFPVPARASLLASLIDRWTGEQRPLALAWREAHAAASSNPALGEPHREWTALWHDFWTRLCRDHGLAGKAELLALFFDGEASQHLIRWHGLLDRALLDETTLALLQFLEQPCTPSSAVRVLYQDLAEREYRLAFGESEEFTAIDDAAAAILSESGLSCLTFRSVASRAGSTLGAVAYHFGSKSKMLRLALQRIYEGSSVEPTAELIKSMPDERCEAAASVVESAVGGQVPLLRALDEIILNLSRSEAADALSGVIRGFRDPIGGAVLRKLLYTPGHASPALVAGFSSVVRGLGHWRTGLPDSEVREIGNTALQAFAACSDNQRD